MQNHKRLLQRIFDKLTGRAAVLTPAAYSSLVRHFNRSPIRAADAAKDSRTFLGLLVLYLIAAAVADLTLNIVADKSSEALYPTLLPSFSTGEPTYNRAMLDYVVLVFFGGGLAVLSWIKFYFPVEKLSRWLSPLLLGATAGIGLISSPFILSEIFFAFALFASFLCWALDKATKKEALFGNSIWGFYWLRIAPFFLAALCVASVYIAALGWYPVTIPSDYYELADQTYISGSLGKTLFPNSNKSLYETEAIQCLVERDRAAKARNITSDENIKIPEKLKSTPPNEITFGNMKCPLSPEELSGGPSDSEHLKAIAQWQVQAGRFLYHHSYLFVPARDFLAHGFNSTVEYRYGYGNTLFHAAMLAIGTPTLTTYFNTLPIAYLFGLISIAFLVFYATRNLFAAISGFALALGALVLMDPGILRLAVGFSPLRYFGLCIQIFSIFYLFRGNESRRAFLLPLAFLVSFFWNREFALLGLAGQGLTLLSPSLDLRILARAAHLGLLVASVIFSIVISSHNSDFTQGQLLSFFGVGVPALKQTDLILFYLSVFAIAGAFFFLISRFSARERDARLAVGIVIALVLVKFLFYSKVDHFDFSLVLVAPMLLSLYSWSASSRPQNSSFRKTRMLESWFCFAVVLFSFIQAAKFSELSSYFDDDYIAPLATSRWQTLHENFVTPIPEAPIAERVNAIKAVMKPEDKVLILSPLDHLLSFYAVPQRYCGHFELLTGLVTQSAVKRTLRCARDSDNLLVIYDKALEIGCPKNEAADYFHGPSCLSKYGLKKTMIGIMRELNPTINMIQEIGDLRFYRFNSRAKEKF